MKHTLLYLAIFVGCILPSTAQQNSSPETKFDMKNYYMVFLKKGPVRNQNIQQALLKFKNNIWHILV